MKKAIMALILLLMFGCSDTYPETPPEGWVIISNGEEYAFVYPSGTISLFPKRSYRAAVIAEWEQYEFEVAVESRETWRVVTE